MSKIQQIDGLYFASRNDIAEMLSVSNSTVSRMISDNVRKVEQDNVELVCLNDIERCSNIVLEMKYKKQKQDLYEAWKDVTEAYQTQGDKYEALKNDYEALQQENETNKSLLLDARLNQSDTNSFVYYIKSKRTTQVMMLFIIIATLFITFYEVVHLPKFQALSAAELIAYVPILLFSVTMSVAVVWTAFNKSNRKAIDNLTLFVFVGVEFSSSANFFGLNEVLLSGTFLQIIITLFLSVGLPTLSIRLANSQANTNRQLSIKDALKAFKKVNKDGLQAVNSFKQYLIK